MIRHFLSDLDISAEEQFDILATAVKMKAHPENFRDVLRSKILGMIFKKNSTRTRASFEAGMIQLGGQAIFLSAKEVQIGRGEPITDTGRVLSSYVDLMMIRTFEHQEVQDLARSASVPVINGLDDFVHPCQALADLMTMQEVFGEVRGKRLVYVGDGNNVAHSLLYAGALAGMHVTIVCPALFSPRADVLAMAQNYAKESGAVLQVTHDLSGVDGADAVYTDVWASMGQEEEALSRAVQFAGYQVNAALMRRANPHAIFLHCLPAHRGEEVTEAVIDGPQSRVFQQAENRLHVQKALMLFLMKASQAV